MGHRAGASPFSFPLNVLVCRPVCYLWHTQLLERQGMLMKAQNYRVKNQEKDTKTLQKFPLLAGNIYLQLADFSHTIQQLSSSKLSSIGTLLLFGSPPKWL